MALLNSAENLKSVTATLAMDTPEPTFLASKVCFMNLEISSEIPAFTFDL